MTQPMTPEKFAERMREIEVMESGMERTGWMSVDPELCHIKADALICGLLRVLGYGEGAQVFERMEKWYA